MNDHGHGHEYDAPKDLFRRDDVSRFAPCLVHRCAGIRLHLVARPRLGLNRSSGLTRFRHDGTVILTSVVCNSFRRELVHRDDGLSRDENLSRVATALDRVLQQVRGDGWPLTARTVLLLTSREPSWRGTPERVGERDRTPLHALGLVVLAGRKVNPPGTAAADALWGQLDSMLRGRRETGIQLAGLAGARTPASPANSPRPRRHRSR